MPTYPTGEVETWSDIISSISASTRVRASERSTRSCVSPQSSSAVMFIETIPTRHSTAIFTTWGGHDITNNFAGEDLDNTGPFINASSAYLTFLGNTNPDPVDSDVHYYNFRYGDNAFFVLDTRRHRTEPKAKIDVEQQNSTTAGGDGLYTPKPRTMLGDKQLTALYSWLGTVNSTTTFKFIVSSVPFTTLWKGSSSAMDGWAAYPEERSALLDVLEYVPNVIVISGDRYEFAVIELRGKILEISGVSSIFCFEQGD